MSGLVSGTDETCNPWDESESATSIRAISECKSTFLRTSKIYQTFYQSFLSASVDPAGINPQKMVQVQFILHYPR